MTRRVAAGLAAAAAAGLLAAGRADPRAAACPRALLPLASPPTADQVWQAEAAALRYARLRYAPARDLAVDGMYVAVADWVRAWRGGAFVASSCGGGVSARTIAVGVVFPVMYADPTPLSAGCGFCAAATFLVSRTGRGWRVWYVI
jgi:hypothetical protein